VSKEEIREIFYTKSIGIIEVLSLFLIVKLTEK